MSNKLLYIGEFPPPFGGVTIKNNLLANMFSEYQTIDVFDLYSLKKNLLTGSRLLYKSLKRNHRVVLGIGSDSRLCILVTIIALIKGKTFLPNVTIFMMGKELPNYLSLHPAYISLLKNVNHIYVESFQLVESFETKGIVNTSYLPNFRSAKNSIAPRNVEQVVRLVYFSHVREEKGIYTVLNAVKELNEDGFQDLFTLDIYGSILLEKPNLFFDAVRQLSNVRYLGEYDSTKNNIYSLLNSYDACCSSSIQEGMSGTNIECKFAGVANVVSSAGFNCECVNDCVNGLIVTPGSIEELKIALSQIIKNHNYLYMLKRNSYDDRLNYSIDNWKDEIINEIS